MAPASDVRAIVLTSSMRRHAYLANVAVAQLRVAGVWREEKSFRPLSYAQSADDETIIRGHFEARDAAEHDYFRDHDRVEAPSYSVAPGGCNDVAAIAAMAALEPQVVLVFGTSLLKQPLIEAFAGRIINVHLGLSPYYRGAGTNFWPLVNGEPEYCGATIHFLDAGVDTGPVIAHVRPAIARGDGPHDIGNKPIVAAAGELAAAAVAHAEAPLLGVPQREGGRLYKRANFSADAVRQLYRNFETGMIEDYLCARELRDGRLHLVRRQGSDVVPQ